jgi:sugar (pentulose or hexulose) kinase
MTLKPDSVIMTLDIGTSGVRCSSYSRTLDHTQFTCAAQAAKTLHAVHVNTGKVRANVILQAVDECVDECLQNMKDHPYEIAALGISSFVMNLVGVDSQGDVVSDEASISYACNENEVTKEVHALKR